MTFFSEYSPFSTFFDVPVFPPNLRPVTLAVLPVPFFTTFSNKRLIISDVFFDNTLLLLLFNFCLIIMGVTLNPPLTKAENEDTKLIGDKEIP